MDLAGQEANLNHGCKIMADDMDVYKQFDLKC